ncbi:type II secretion system protein GspM [Massilia horti]|uniref:Type II secretion system protein M n=1 Tax=Massilia horti TaxID=2562153 RepID=A0A4Y9T6Y1_9BURK|nr:type II secretion system protein GspM [Massilia horti]TFW34121.1 type II secretion system protein M [Massilia horti]
MSFASTTAQLRAHALAYWGARTEQERKYLTAGAAVVLLALAWMLLLAPAIKGRAELSESLPKLRQQAAVMQTLAQEATALKNAPVPQVTPMTQDSLHASLAARGLKPQSLSLTGEYAKIQFNDVSFANLVTWLDAQRRESRITVQDAAVTALPVAGQVDATITLRQTQGTGGAQ